MCLVTQSLLVLKYHGTMVLQYLCDRLLFDAWEESNWVAMRKCVDSGKMMALGFDRGIKVCFVRLG